MLNNKQTDPGNDITSLAEVVSIQILPLMVVRDRLLLVLIGEANFKFS